MPTKPKCCRPEEGEAVWDHLKRRLKELGLSEKGGVLRLVVTTERIRNLFEITKLLTVIDTFTSEQDALAGLPR